MRQLKIAICFLGLLAFSMPTNACTTAVISGKATADGRPVLWKNRDAPYRDNQVAYFSKGKLKCMAVVNAGRRDAVWMGVNEAGFCIENSLCRDLTEPNIKGPGNGGLMLRALQTCATVADFEQLLRDTNGRRATNATYGVIDARGGAMLFEVAGSRYQRFDANDPADAPQGYVVRSNFTMLSHEQRDLTDEQLSEIYSADRYSRADTLIRQALIDGKVTTKYVLQNCARDLADNSGEPICGSINGELGQLPEWIDTASTISRRTSVSAAVFQGVLPGEDPRLTTMWVAFGQPGLSVAVPCWVHTGKLAEPLTGDKKSSLCTLARELRADCYAQPNQDGAEWLRSNKLPEIWNQTLAAETSLLDRVGNLLGEWRKQTPSADEMYRLHDTSVQLAEQCMRSLIDSAAVSGSP